MEQRLGTPKGDALNFNQKLLNEVSSLPEEQRKGRAGSLLSVVIIGLSGEDAPGAPEYINQELELKEGLEQILDNRYKK
ncbi:MAG: hypothetical protein A3D74_03305 [Candidatus Levybacteria bacterium RIFCSPHIGHO2_02_FULL_37_13]|nr:MAG: hypothetical protein A3D74_03305 [Candidatus Levybacteria bacterium RIFCSPHIGHO2_02_FULL_37_13]OGH30465.1 MAG: hypothetical protein A3E40_03735 [Candidatus Levybacteria bacterium RIFCSPHIGHO2_12_FULL_37_9]OGH40005.1 MAG: hypothetical protein A3B41_03440 [Candidatus Levybacteria bacterium RIFCSPLOWO2_01_FULL_37_26]